MRVERERYALALLDMMFRTRAEIHTMSLMSFRSHTVRNEHQRHTRHIVKTSNSILHTKWTKDIDNETKLLIFYHR